MKSEIPSSTMCLHSPEKVKGKCPSKKVAKKFAKKEKK